MYLQYKRKISISQINKNIPVTLQLLRRIYKCGKKWKEEASLVSPVACEQKLTWVVTMGVWGTQPFTAAKSSPTQELGINTSKCTPSPCWGAWLCSCVRMGEGKQHNWEASAFVLHRWGDQGAFSEGVKCGLLGMTFWLIYPKTFPSIKVLGT